MYYTVDICENHVILCFKKYKILFLLMMKNNLFYDKIKGCIIYSLIKSEQEKYFNISLKILDVLKSMYIENTKK